MSIDIDRVVAQIVDEREGVVGPGPEVDSIVAGGRRRVRRRRVAGGAGGAAVAAAAAGAALASGLLTGPAGGPEPVQPAVSTTTFGGCTLEPETCDPDVITSWAEDLAPGLTVDELFWEPVPDMVDHVGEGIWFDGSLEGTGAAADTSSIGKVSGSLATSIDVDKQESGMRMDSQAIVTRRSVDVPVGDRTVTATVLTAESFGDWSEYWVVPEGDDHGALLIGYEGAYPAGVEKSEGATPPPSSGWVDGSKVTGWTDERVSELIADLLTAPPA